MRKLQLFTALGLLLALVFPTVWALAGNGDPNAFAAPQEEGE